MAKPLSPDEELHHELSRDAEAFASEAERLIRTGAGIVYQGVPIGQPITPALAEPDDDTEALEREAFGSKP